MSWPLARTRSSRLALSPERSIALTSSMFRKSGMFCSLVYGKTAPLVRIAQFRSSIACRGLRFESISRSKNPRHDHEQHSEEHCGHRETEGDADIRNPVETPAKAADQVYGRVEQGDGLPERWQHVDRIETPAEKSERRDHDERDQLQLLEPVGPDADDEPEEAEAHRCQHEE